MEKTDSTLFLKRILAGFIIGVGFIIPGVSGGVIAVSLGLYERIIDAITGFFSDPRRNLRFLLPLALGGAIGILLCAQIITFLMAHWKTPVLLLFMGLVLGGVPGVVHEAHRDGSYRPRYLIAAAAGLALFSMIAVAELLWVGGASEGTFGFIESFFSGIAVSFGTIIPGVSSSFLLMMFQWFEPVVTALSSFDILALLPAGVSAVITSLALLKLVQYIFDRHRAYAYYTVAGFTVGMAALLLYNIVSDAGSGFSPFHLVFFIAGIVGGYLTSARRTLIE